MSEFTFLTVEQCFGEETTFRKKEPIDIIKKRGTKAAITDFSILLGGYVSSTEFVSSDDSLEGRTGWYWTKSDDGDSDARAVYDVGYKT